VIACQDRRAATASGHYSLRRKFRVRSIRHAWY
jgi:hypothetical protein